MNLRLAMVLGLLVILVVLLHPLTVGAEPLAQPRIPHSVEGRDNCLACHGPGGLKPVPASHAGRTVATCRGCHQLATAGSPAEPTAAPVAVATPTQVVVATPSTTATTPRPSAVTSPTAVPTSTAPLPKTGDADFLIAGIGALVLILVGLVARRYAAIIS